MRRDVAVGVAGLAVVVAILLAIAQRGDGGARCGPGFESRGTRCLVPTDRCPPPLLPTSAGCDAPDVRVPIAAASITIGPGDWEAERAVPPRTVRVAAFRLDAFEVTRGRYERATADPARAAAGMSRNEGAAFCASQGGRLPTEDEWMVAAGSERKPPPRYPWGDTGAVCRRAAWGLTRGPCATGADGPDTVGAHPDGDSLVGLHDLAGNVAEWVSPDAGDAGAPALDIAKGGSYASRLATELRIWARVELPSGSRDARVGLRCAYPP
ncbi:MAG TPA: SUMF1/EgtB/PvdO family nonheme iron enzyme [Polyangiaceae bacterium]|nr:SUMF1/EgtB/PvdO family nonheme iron enzyme [Polyangiaceae bacterium]